MEMKKRLAALMVMAVMAVCAVSGVPGAESEAETGSGQTAGMGSQTEETEAEQDAFSAGTTVVTQVMTPYYSFTIPPEWEGRYTVEAFTNDWGSRWLRVFHKYENGGGHLFSIEMTQSDDYDIYPSYRLLGTLTDAEGEEYNLIALFPTDVQYTRKSMESYTELYRMVGGILETICAAEGCSFTEAR